MATATAPTDGAGAALPRTDARRIALARHAPIAGLFAGAFALYLVLALRSPLPVMWPDEFRYEHLAKSFAAGDGFAWRGNPVSQPAALYIYFLSPVWALFKSTVTAYELSKALGALALSAQVIPVYLLARRALGARLALVPAALSVAGTWMLASAHIITESLALPLSTTALCLCAMTLYRPSRRTGFLALAFALLAAWARVQLGVLIPALAVAFALDVILRPREERAERLDAHLYYLAAAAGITLVGAVLLLVAPNAVGDYSTVFGSHPPLGKAFLKTALELGGLTTASGFVPVLLLAAAGVRPRSWRDSALGPLMCVFWPAALITAVQAGFFLAGVGTHRPLWWGIERYVAYALPIGFVGVCVLARDRRLLDWRVLAGAGGLAVLLILHPHGVAISEERASWSTSYRTHQLLGTGTGLSLAIVAFIGVAVVAATDQLKRHSRTLVAVAAVTAAVLVVQDQASWHYLTNVTRTFRSSLPSDLQWIDHNARGDVAVINLTEWDPTVDSLDFFNRRLTASYGPPNGLPGRPLAGGRTCSWVVQATGAMTFQKNCLQPPRAFLVNDPAARLTFHNEIAVAEDAHIGRLAQLGAGAPRLRSLIVLPCPRLTPTFSLSAPKYRPASAPTECGQQLGGELWLDRPASLTIRYAAGGASGDVKFGKRTWHLPMHATTDVTIPVPKGQYRFTFDQSWAFANIGNPRIADIRLTAAGRSSSLL